MDIYYVYHHVDPRTKQIMYVGLGTQERAWMIRNRSKEHIQWVNELYDCGFTLNEFVFIKEKKLNKKAAMEKEKEDVGVFNPVFNKLLNKNHWNKQKKGDRSLCSELKALREMGYTFYKIAFLSGSATPNTHATSIKRMIEYV